MTEDLYLIPDQDRIDAARWAAIDVLFPAIERRAGLEDRRPLRRQRPPVWHHSYDSAGGIHSECSTVR